MEKSGAKRRKRVRWDRVWSEIVSRILLEPFPFARMFRGYNRAAFFCDIKAGVNVALLAFPQGMAYAMLAGLPIQYGVYCSAVAAVIAPLWSSSRYTMIGPTNATAVMLLSVFLTLPPELPKLQATALIVFMAGIFLIVGAFCQVSTLLKFVSRSVMIGYITGAAFLIIANQLHFTLGTPIESAGTLFGVLASTAGYLPEATLPAIIITVVTLLVMLVLRRYLPQVPDVAVALVIASGVGVALMAFGWNLDLVQSMPVGTWPVTPPPMNYEWFFLLAGPAAAIAFLGAMESVVMSKSLAGKTGEPVNTNQEMLSLGLSNIGSGFLSGMPASGSLTRSQLNFDSGARSPMASIFSGLLCAIGAFTLGPLTGYIPKAALATVVILVAVSLIDFKKIRVALKATKSDAAVLITTFVAALMTPLDFAIFLGVGVSIALFLKKASAPSLVEYSFNEEGNLAELETPRENPYISIIHVEGNLFFGAADLFRDEIRNVCRDPQLRIVVLRMRNAHHLDATSVMALQDLIEFLRKEDRDIIVSGATREVYRVMRNTGALEVLGKKNFFMGSTHNPNVSTRNALKRAREILGPEQADVKIYYDPAFETARQKKKE